MDAVFLAVVHGDHDLRGAGDLLLHLLHPQHWAVPLLAITGGLLAVRAVRRGLQQELGPGAPLETDRRP